MKFMMILAAALSLPLAMPAHAQGTRPVFKSIATPVDSAAIALPTVTGPTANTEIWAESKGLRSVRNVTRPTLTPVLPDRAKATGAAVIVAPGGAFLLLSIDNEGFAVARWLADHGIAAFVLKYRTETTDPDPGVFGAQFGARMRGPAQTDDARRSMLGENSAREDGLAAIRLVRHDAAKWGIDPARIGFMGFSAGAMTALNVALANDPTARPNFIAPIYPPMGSRTIPAGMPPMFTAIASNDPLFANNGYGLVQDWQKSGAPVELHVYEKGGHGFGFTPQGTTSDHWLTEFHWWLDARGMLKAR